MAYASVANVQARMNRELSTSEESICTELLTDASLIIDAYASGADEDIKQVVACRMVIRAIGNGEDYGVPAGATQGSMAALGYSQSWTMGSGSSGELYISSAERRMLGMGNAIGSYSPIEELVEEDES